MPKIRRVMDVRERRVRVKLAERGMCVGDLCERVGCSPQYLWLMFTGARSGAKYWDAICRELGLSGVDELYRGA